VNAYVKYLPFKSAVEDLFGRDAWYALKESNHLPTWRKYAGKVLRAVELSIRDTVEIYDDEWLEQVTVRLRQGSEQVAQADAIDEVIGVVAGTMIEVSFLQIGSMPRRKGKSGPFLLRRGEWRFNGFRSVAYLQTKAQEDDVFLAAQRRKLGFEKELDLQAEHRASRSKLSYAEWCRQKKGTKGAA
jgi:hypothetical protein